MGAIPASWAAALLGESSWPVFGLAGSSNLRFLAAHRTQGGVVVQAQHEAAAVAMAAGWAEASGRVGVASVHQGPGFTNALTALIDADRGWLPIVLVTGHDDDPEHHQHVDTLGLCERVGLPVVVPSTTSEVELTQALAMAATLRQPVVLLPPVANTPPVSIPLQTESNAVQQIPPDITERIGAAARVALIAGRGAVRTGALDAIAALADQIDALLLTSAPAHGAFADNPRYAGSIGGFATEGTTQALRGCDVVIAFGASLDQWSTAGGRTFADDALIVRVDPRTPHGQSTNAAPNERRRFAHVPMDAGACATALGAILAPRTRDDWAHQAAARGRARRPGGPSGANLDPRTLLDQLDSLLPRKRRIVLDSGHFIAFAAMYLTSFDGPHLHFGQDFQSVGLGLAKAIGAASTLDDRLTLCVLGDGGAGMSFLELATAVDLRLPMIVVVMNDAAYGAEVHDFEPLRVDVSVAQFTSRDWAAVATALGASAQRVCSLADLTAITDWLQTPSGPLVLDCQIDPAIDAVTVMTPEGAAEWSCAE